MTQLWGRLQCLMPQYPKLYTASTCSQAMPLSKQADQIMYIGQRCKHCGCRLPGMNRTALAVAWLRTCKSVGAQHTFSHQATLMPLRHVH